MCLLIFCFTTSRLEVSSKYLCIFLCCFSYHHNALLQVEHNIHLKFQFEWLWSLESLLIFQSYDDELVVSFLPQISHTSIVVAYLFNIQFSILKVYSPLFLCLNSAPHLCEQNFWNLSFRLFINVTEQFGHLIIAFLYLVIWDIWNVMTGQGDENWTRDTALTMQRINHYTTPRNVLVLTVTKKTLFNSTD